ncbi:hypothetical protein QJS10_CPA08g00017 [Acorus calamus]|uniref:Uncharacterized protein n=1 Tax=Acorus calamus TaxID=4465 RepID=A0AAV9EE12_ACOCL|nr:hypothetical protein QJS10_CPA08g00017 [Acorus calamus]
MELQFLLIYFSKASGHHLNPEKSQLFCTSNQDLLSQYLGIPLCNLPVKHLGLPLQSGCLSNSSCLPLIDKMKKRIQSWTDVCLPKEEGGLGLKRIGEWNKATMGTRLWEIATNHPSLWASWMKARQYHPPRTPILSKRWKDLFSSFPTLDYCDTSINYIYILSITNNYNQKYIDIVDGLLRLSNATHVRRLHLDFFIGEHTPPIPDHWITFADGISSLTELVVCFRGCGHWNLNSDRIRPSLVRILSSVQSLKLNFKGTSLSGFPWPGSSWGGLGGCYFGGLKSLSLDLHFTSMLNLCPPLESIHVHHMNRLVLSGRNASRLKTLDVGVWEDVELGPARRLQEILDHHLESSPGLFNNVKRLHLDTSYYINEEKLSLYDTLIVGLPNFPYVEKLSIKVDSSSVVL